LKQCLQEGETNEELLRLEALTIKLATDRESVLRDWQESILRSVTLGDAIHSQK
jgi:hypothetical protein